MVYAYWIKRYQQSILRIGNKQYTGQTRWDIFCKWGLSKNINKHLNLLKEKGKDGKFGSTPIVFYGDFTQLEPVCWHPLILTTETEVRYGYVNTFIELKNNH